MKLPGEDKDAELCWIHTQVVAEPLHAFFQDGIFVLVLVAAEQLADVQHRQPVSVQVLIFPRVPHHRGDDWGFHSDFLGLGAIQQLAAGFATQGTGLFFVPPAAFLVLRLGAAVLVSTFAAEGRRWVLTLGDTLAHVFLPGPLSAFPHL